MNAQKILVPLDGSTLAESALPTAIRLAKAFGASLHLVRAAEAGPAPGGDPIEAQIRVVREAEDYVKEIEQRVAADGVAAATSVWYGRATESIVEAADVNHVDLIVMSTHGRTGLGRLFLGSVAESVLRAAHVPVLLLRTGGRPTMFKRVLVPLDGSELAEEVLPFLTEIAGPLDIELTLLRVVVPVPPEYVEGTRYITVENIPARMEAARAYLAPIAAGLEAKGVRATTELRRGEPLPEILEAAKAAKVDLVAMTTHGRTGLGRLLFGSVAEAVLRHSEVPVFLVRGAKKPAATAVA